MRKCALFRILKKIGNWDGYVRYTLYNYVASEIVIYIAFGAPQEASEITKMADFCISRNGRDTVFRG